MAATPNIVSAPGAGLIETGWWTPPLAGAVDPLHGRPLTLRVCDVARELGMSVKTVRRLDQTGKLPEPIRDNHSIRWPTDDFLAWLAAGRPSRAEWSARKERIGPRLAQLLAESN